MKKVRTTIYLEEWNHRFAQMMIPNLTKWINEKISEFSAATEGKVIDMQKPLPLEVFFYNCPKHGDFSFKRKTKFCPFCSKQLTEVKKNA